MLPLLICKRWFRNLSKPLLLLFLLTEVSGWAQKPLARTIIALYDSKAYSDIWYTPVHQFAEMPLNHLGARLEYYDIRKGLPDIVQREEVIGVIVWFSKYTVVPDAEGYVAWVASLTAGGKKFVLLGPPGIYREKEPLTAKEINTFWNGLGLEDGNDWVSDTYHVQFAVSDPKVMDFERVNKDIKQPFHVIKVIDPSVKVHLMARKWGDGSTDSVLVATCPNGGYACEGYAKYEIFSENDRFREWYINPFEFFRLAFDLDKLPKPDNTTLVGRRIYYSHVDGDGWNSVTQIEGYRNKKALCAEVIYQEIVRAYPELPLTISCIGADIDPKWVGKTSGIEAAKRIFSEPHVEIASHTYSHPFSWQFFEDYSMEREEPYLNQYHFGTWKGNLLWTKMKTFLGKVRPLQGKDHSIIAAADGYEDSADATKENKEGYETPRAYANQPFSLKREIKDSIAIVNSLAPKGKEASLIQWSGNCQPFAGAIASSRALGISNLNGGDSRFDEEFYSYAWVRPIGRSIGSEQQIYASSSNENTYTDLWTKRFYGFGVLPETWRNTDSPIRLLPLNLYYHIYSGEKKASLNAVKANLEYASKVETIPIKASHYAAIGHGFYTFESIPLGERFWKFKNRGALQTVRFDHASQEGVDFNKSQGVIGQRHLHGSLYVSLDPLTEEPLLALKTKDVNETTPYLVESRWEIKDLQREQDHAFKFWAKGYGTCAMKWSVGGKGRWEIEGPGESVITQAQEGKIAFDFGGTSYEYQQFTVRKME